MKYLALLFALVFPALVHAKPATNIILVIGDGMGPAYTSAYRYYLDNSLSPQVETTIFDQLLTGTARTHPDNHNLVTDSAAAATALASGVKTFNGAIGVDAHKKPVTSLLELAKARGYRTAIITTSSVNHATPASFVAHVNSRHSYAQIADQYFDQRISGNHKVDLLLGGGRQFFVREDRDLAAEFKAAGYGYITDLTQLDTIRRLPALGLFAEDGLESALNSAEPGHLPRMTAKALSLLNDKPFFLLVEASQIDWCGHANDIACAMAEMQDMAVTLEILKDYVDQHPNSILVATADHGTGGLSLNAPGQQRWNADVIKGVRATAARIADILIADTENWKLKWQQLTAIKLTAQEARGMQQLMNRASELHKLGATGNITTSVKNAVMTLTLAVINERSHTLWTTTGHTGEDVQIFSHGKARENFAGNLDNTDIAKRLFEYLPEAR